MNKTSSNIVFTSNLGDTLSIPLTTQGSVAPPRKLGNSNKVLYIAGDDAGFPNVAVGSTEKTLQAYFKNISKEDAKQLFPTTWTYLKDKDLEKIHKDEKEFEGFCTMLVLFLVSRQVLFKIPIPVCDIKN